MRLRDQLGAAPARPSTARREAHGVIETGFIPASTVRQMGRELVQGPEAPDEGEIDPKTGVLMCRGKDVCTLNLCSNGRYAHGRHPEPEDPIAYFPPGSTGVTAGVYQGEGERITEQIRAGVEAAEQVLHGIQGR